MQENDLVLILQSLRTIMRAVCITNPADDLLHQMSAVEDRIRELEKQQPEASNA